MLIFPSPLIRRLALGAILLSTGALSACSTGTPASTARDSGFRASPVGRALACQWDRSACMYEGAYEPNEAAYAEEEARRLNKAAAARVRRGFF